ncbi:MAG TPA: hypothetical protein VJK02_26190 [Anaerolineales bacterium]|nr:hypothetical protein [Anaerolineales bacterium]
MILRLKTTLGTLVRPFLHNEKGQDALVWLFVILVLWLILVGRRIVVQ